MGAQEMEHSGYSGEAARGSPAPEAIAHGALTSLPALSPSCPRLSTGSKQHHLENVCALALAKVRTVAALRVGRRALQAARDTGLEDKSSSHWYITITVAQDGVTEPGLSTSAATNSRVQWTPSPSGCVPSCGALTGL